MNTRNHHSIILALLASSSQAITYPTVMPLGDSNTAGYQPAWANPYGGGYRETLENALPPAVDFVGPRSDWASATIRDPDHNGNLGWTIAPYGGRNGLQTNIAGWLNTYNPGIVLLQIGTNDLDLGKPVPDALADLHLLIVTINTTRPSAKVYVATLPPLTNATKNLNVLQFNSQLGTALIGTTAKPGPDVYAAVNGRLIDSWHPTEAALKDVGRSWAQRIAKDFPRVGVQQ